jgi:hypothetical protein
MNRAHLIEYLRSQDACRYKIVAKAHAAQLSVDHTKSDISRLEHGATGRQELGEATSPFC